MIGLRDFLFNYGLYGALLNDVQHDVEQQILIQLCMLLRPRQSSSAILLQH